MTEQHRNPAIRVLMMPRDTNVHETIFGGLAPKLTGAKATNQKPALTAMQRNLQREYVSHLIFILLRGERHYPAPIQTLARYYVKQLANTIKAALTVGVETDTYTRAHLEECQTRLERALEASYTLDR